MVISRATFGQYHRSCLSTTMGPGRADWMVFWDNPALWSHFGSLPADGTSSFPPFPSLLRLGSGFCHFADHLSWSVLVLKRVAGLPDSEILTEKLKRILSSPPKASFCVSRRSNGSTWLRTGGQMAVLVETNRNELWLWTLQTTVEHKRSRITKVHIHSIWLVTKALNCCCTDNCH